MSKTAIKIENLTKAYRLGQIGTGTISHDLNRFFAKVMGKEDPMSFVGNTKDRQSQVKYIKVLDDINLEVEKGQILGIIGKNGAGKSTLLKIISQITTPTSGRVKYKGKIASLLEVGTGMHQEMTARENIYLNGSILGMKKKDIDKKFDDIIDFSGCSLFVDTPVKRFSSGMRVRLGFAVAAFLDPDILIVDEVLAVGDYEFQKNAVGKIKEVSSNEGRTVLFVSHNMGSIKNICDSGIVLNNGKLIHENKNISNLVNFYQNQSISKNNDISLVKRDGLGNIIFADFKILNKNGEESSQFCSGDTIRFQMTLKSEITEKVAVQIAIGIKSTDDRICSMLANEYLDKTLYVENGINQVFCCLENIPFSFGKFSINLIVKRNQITEDWIKELTFFEILGGGYLTESYTYPESYRGVYLNTNGMVNEFFTKQGTIKLTLKRILLKDPYNYSFIDESSKLQGFKFCKKKYITIKSINNSKIIIGRNVVLKNVSINCNNNSELIIGDDVRIENAVIKLDNNSKCKLGNNCIIGSLSNSPLSFYLNNGQMQIGEMSKLMLDKIQVRFGGCLNIGRYGGFGNRSEIRCDQKIDIGNFCLCSYNVSIYDTNVHSVDPGKREEWIIDQFPQGLTDLEKPKTDPVILGDNLWIGKNAVILKGSEIASASVIGINAVLSNIKDKTPKTYVSNKPISF